MLHGPGTPGSSNPTVRLGERSASTAGEPLLCSADCVGMEDAPRICLSDNFLKLPVLLARRPGLGEPVLRGTAG